MTWTPERIAQGINGEDAIALVSWLVDEQPAEDVGAAALRAWAEVGETPEAVAALVGWLQERAVQVPLSRPAMDVCGTGGSGLTRYNVSTTVAFVLATLGVPVAKHGNRGSQRPNGSFDLLDELSIRFDLSPESQVNIFDETNLVFCFARQHHPIVGKVGAYRKAAGCRTIFNLSGPLANPAPMAAQLIGVADASRQAMLASTLETLGLAKYVVVSGQPGIDEVSISGQTTWLAAGGASGSCDINLVDDYAQIPGGDAAVNAELFRGIMTNQEDPGTALLSEMVIANAATAVACWRGEPISPTGVAAAECRDALVSGRVAALVKRYTELSQELAP